MDKNLDPIQMGLVPEDALPPLPPEIEELEAPELPSRARRLLRLATPVLEAVAAEAGEGPHALYTGLPQLDAAKTPWLGSFHRLLGVCARVPIDLATSRTFPLGRAAGLLALEAGLKALEQGVVQTVIVGGVDTFFDLHLLDELDDEGRILGPGVADGFIPGEGAGFLVMKAQTPSTGAGRTILALGAASLPDPGHRYGEEPAKGEGLAKTLEHLRAGLDLPPPPVGTTFAGFNGESFDAKMWGVAHMRHTDFFSPAMSLQHPASTMGDTGAASGAIMSALAANALSQGHRMGPAFVWAASDREARACALIGMV